jgi:CheY-like chemotaxis protein
MNTRASEPVILLVDDDEETYNLYSDFLASSGFAVVGANDGEEAIRVAQREQPSLVIMDLGLPLLDGCEATRLLRSDPRTANVPILAMTGYVQRHFIELARQAGCDAFLCKPCPLERLLSEARRLIGIPDNGTSTGPKPRILLVEDDDEIREALTDVLEQQGYLVEGARNGREALELLHDHEAPRLILLDLMMPVMDGWQFRHAQLEDPMIARIPVVVLSAMTNLRTRTADLHAAECLAKPVDVAYLLEAVSRYS